MWLKKLKRQKLQFFLIGLVLFVAAALLSLCLCFSVELSAFSKAAINRENCPDAYILTVGTQNFADHFTDENWKGKVTDVTALVGKTVTAPIQYKGKDITQLHDMALSADSYQDFGYLTLQAGNEGAVVPKKGEVWISETLANPNQIKLGDTLTLNYDTSFHLTVTGIYRSTCFPKAVGFSPMLVSNEELTGLPGGDEAALFAANTKKYSDSSVKTLFENSAYSVVTRTRDNVQSSLMEYSGSIGAIGAMAAIVVFFVALILLCFIVRSNLLKEYQTIGIYKSLGFPSKEIAGIYQKGYLLVGCTAITLGAFSSLSLVGLIGSFCTAYVDGFEVGAASLLVCLTVILLLVAVLYLNLSFTLRRVRRITPVEAIKTGNTRLEQKLPPSVIRFAKSPLSVAINVMFKYKKSTITLLLTITASIFLSMFFAMIWTSADQMLDNANLWFNLPKNDAYVTGNISEELKDYLEKSNHVKSTVYGDFGNYQLKVEGYPQLVSYIRFDTYSTFDTAATGIQMVDGRGPQGTTEVAVGENLLRLLGLSVGDSMTLTIHDTTKDFMVSGTYATMAESGQKIMLTTDAVSACMEYQSTRAFVRLHTMADYEAFKQAVENEFSGIAVDTSWFAMENSVETIRGMLKSISMVLIAAFLTFSILNIIIVLLMEHKSGRRKYGILKSLGFSAKEIISQNLCKYFILSIIGSTIALSLHLLFSRKLGAAMLIDAFVNSSLMLALLTAGFVLLILITTLLISLSVKKISPVELMEE